MNPIDFPKPVLGLAALSGTGKTELLTALLQRLKQAGIRCAVIKHAHHDVDIDKPGKDSYRAREAGANPVILASEKRIALMIERDSSPLELQQCLDLLNPTAIDLVLIEGFKQLPVPKLFLFRHAIKQRHQPLDDEVAAIMNMDNTLAIVSDLDAETILAQIKHPKPVLDMNNIDAIYTFVIKLINSGTTHE